MTEMQKAKGKMQKAGLSRGAMLTAACLLLCLGATPRPPVPKLPLVSPKAAGVQVSAPMARAAVVIPPKQIRLTWGYPVALSPDLTFNIYRTADLRQPFRHVADVDAPPAVFPAESAAGYFLCRTSNRITHEVSGWNVRGKL